MSAVHSAVQMRVEGADRLAATMHAAARKLASWEVTNARAAGLVADAARGRAPRRTGQLIGSVGTRLEGGAGALVEASARHAGPINYGVGPRPGRRGPHNIRATRFFSDALPTTSDRVVDLYADRVASAIASIKGA